MAQSKTANICPDEWVATGRFVDVSLPTALRDHPAVKGRVFYTLPTELLHLLLKHILKQEFDKELLALERRLSELSGDHRSLVGYWNGKAVFYHTLREPLKFRRPYVTPGLARRLGSRATSKELKEAFAKAKDMVRMIEDALRGYCGWLVTNKQFVAEHDQLLSEWKDELDKLGFPVVGAVVHKATKPRSTRSKKAGREQAFVDAFEQFYVRWRLVGMVAPRLPCPIGPCLAPMPPAQAFRRAHMGGAIYHLPDTFPIPSRDDLRAALENARNVETPPHLADWADRTRGGNRGKGSIYPFGRLFELQHFWRVLHERHAKALRDRGHELRRAFAKFLSKSTETIRKDLKVIIRRLGPDWHHRA